MSPNQFTICITNFSRPDHLRRCLESVKSLPNVVVACYGAGPDHAKIIEQVRPGTRCYVTPNDHGENRLLMQAVVMADTPWVVILHDDDQLVPEFQSAMEAIPAVDYGFIGWDGVSEWYGEKQPNNVYPYGRLKTGVQPVEPLADDVMLKHGGMVRSPVTMMLRRDLAMAVLSWCETGLADFHTRPTMMIGNEIALLFGHVKASETWYHVAKPLVKFGHWEGSETCKWLNGECPELVNLYDRVRERFGGEQFLFRHDRIKPVLVHVHTTGGDNQRKPLARQTWETEWRKLEKEWLIVPLCLKSEDMARTSAVLGDPRKLPFVRDLIGRATGFCFNPHDVVMLTNDDVCITADGLAPMVARAVEHGSTYAHRRTFHDTELVKIGLASLSRVLTPDEVATGRRHSGTDAVLCTRQWWQDIGNRNMPDFVIGCEAWDTVWIMVSRLSGSGWGFRNTTYHEYHGGTWEGDEMRFHNPGQLHNRKIAKRMLVTHGIYRGEFEDGVKRDPAYPKHSPGCDTDPGVPVVRYVGIPRASVPASGQPPPPRQPDPTRLPPPERFQEPPKPTIPRAIVYPWKAIKAQWHELKYSIRSIEEHFADKECPIYILGTEEPNWLSKKHGRAKYLDCWTYQDAIVRGTQLAEEVLWMNDDIVLLKDCGWDDFRPARHLGKADAAKATGLLTTGDNSWRRGLGRAMLALIEHGIDEPWNFSTHIPYIYGAERALEIFRTYGVWAKIQMETLYMNHHRIEPVVPVDGFKVRQLPFGDATVLNYNDGILENAEFRAAIEAMFPEPSACEYVANRKPAFA